jgi:hypothetical protein
MAQADYVNNAFLALVPGATAKPSTNPVRATHVELVSGLAGNPPRPIPVDTDVVDLEERAEHLKQVLHALSVYVTAILDDTAQNVPGRFDLRYIDALLSDSVSDVTGTVRHAAAGMAGRVA